MCTIGIPHSDLHVERAGERDESGTVAVRPMLAHLGQVEIAHVGVHKMHVVALFVVISATTRARAALAVRPFTPTETPGCTPPRLAWRFAQLTHHMR